MTTWSIEKEIDGCQCTDLRSMCFRDERWMKLAQHGVRLRKFLVATWSIYLCYWGNVWLLRFLLIEVVKWHFSRKRRRVSDFEQDVWVFLTQKMRSNRSSLTVEHESVRNIDCTVAFLSAFKKFAKNGYELLNILPPVRTQGTTRLSLDRFSWNLIFEDFFVKFVEKIHVSLKSVKNNRYIAWRPIYIFWSYFAHFFLE
jgi:hypothetical protein